VSVLAGMVCKSLVRCEMAWVVLLTALVAAVAASPPTEVVATSRDGNRQLVVERLGEGFHAYRLGHEGTTTTIWKSFWGRGSAVFSDDGRYLALLDARRFDLIGPVLVFRIESGQVTLVYQSPASFDQDEDRFNYGLGSFEGANLSVHVYRNEFSATRSRASRGPGFSYLVNCAHLRPVTPTFYGRDSGLYLNVNDLSTSEATSGTTR
jgi:hypothetical protein